MLPFLKPKKSAGVIVTERTLDSSKQESSYDNEGLVACAYDLISAIESKDSRAVAEALKAAFEICEAAPHEEGPHTNSYNEMNALAARGNK